jgi:DNA-binding NarL/FixJ family response regulator
MKISKLVLADDHPVYLSGLSAFLSKMPHIEIVGTALDGTTLLQLLPTLALDLLLLDLDMPNQTGIEVLQILKKKYYPFKILVLTKHNEAAIVKEVIQLGVYGYLLKTNHLDEIPQAIDSVLQGKFYWGKGIINDIWTGEDLKSVAQNYPLTKREQEILAWIATAKSDKEIGDQLEISDKTVGVHRKNIMRKIGVSTTRDLVRLIYKAQTLAS